MRDLVPEFGNSLPFRFPTVVSPFHYFDLHGSVQQSVYDLTAIHNLRSAAQSENTVNLNARQAREEVVLTVTDICLQLMATIAEVEEQQAEVRCAEATYQQAQADAGNKAPIEANRSLGAPALPTTPKELPILFGIRLLLTMVCNLGILLASIQLGCQRNRAIHHHLLG